jgi:hypothetical protein
VSEPIVTGARGTGGLKDLLRPDYSAFKKRKKRPKKRPGFPRGPPSIGDE